MIGCRRQTRAPMRRSPAHGWLALLLIGAAAGGAWGQAGDRPAPEAPAGALNDPVPYERSEFPEWAHALRRAEVIAIGSLPLTLFGVRMVYGYARWAAHGFADDMPPFPFGPIGGGAGLNETEELGIVIGAAALSVTIALIDADLQRTRPPAARDR